MRNIKKTLSTFTLVSPHTTTVPEKNNKVTNTTLYDIHLSEQTYHVICVRNWHNSGLQITTLAKLPTYSES